jgi:hypothetical protein
MIKELHSIPKGKYCCGETEQCHYLKILWEVGVTNTKAKCYYCTIYGTNWYSTIKGKPVKCSQCLSDFPKGAKVIAVGMI